MFVRPSTDEILRQIWDTYSASVDNVPDLNSSQIGLLTKAFTKAIESLYGYVEQIYRDSQISTMSGTALDQFGLLVGVTRKQASQSTTYGGPRSVRFTNNGVSTVNIPVNTRIWAKAQPQLVFFTTEGLTLNSGNSGEVHATAATEGSVYNVGVGVLDTHNVPHVSIVVTNILPVGNGEYEESDDSFRERIVQEFRRRKVLTIDNVVALMRGIPGVKDAILLNMYRGEGTYDIIIIPESTSNAAALLSKAAEELNANNTAGVSAVVRLPNYKQLDIKINLSYNSTITNRESIRESVRTQIRARIDTLALEAGNGEGTLHLPQLKATAVLADNSVTDAVMLVGMEGESLNPDGNLYLEVGERIVLRSLEVI